MVCEEADPRRTYTRNNDPVYKDSAMEAFFQFFPEGDCRGIYLNFEMNANGALLAMHGSSREGRTFLNDAQINLCECRAEVADTKWSVRLTVPLPLLREIYGDFTLREGSVFSCNFYKISEDKSIEHYASYAPVISDTPNFHMPECFARAVLTL